MKVDLGIVVAVLLGIVAEKGVRALPRCNPASRRRE
jgi:hypothetical protein